MNYRETYESNVPYGYASRIEETREQRCVKGRAETKNICTIAGIFILLFPANSAKCFHNDFVLISISDSAHPRRRGIRRFIPRYHSPFTVLIAVKDSMNEEAGTTRVISLQIRVKRTVTRSQ